MPNDLTVNPFRATTRAHAAQDQVSPAAAPAPFTSASSTTGAPSSRAPSLPNPSLRLDPGLGVVVLQYHDGAGNITRSIPTQRQLAAYREVGAPLPGSPPAESHHATAARAPAESGHEAIPVSDASASVPSATPLSLVAHDATVIAPAGQTDGKETPSV